MISALHFNYIRVLSRLFSLGEKIESDGGWGAAVVGHSFLGGGVWGYSPPPPPLPRIFINFVSFESGSEAF